MSLRRAWLLFGALLSFGAALAVFASHQLNLLWAERTAFEWLRNTWAQGAVTYEEEVVQGLARDAAVLRRHADGALAPADWSRLDDAIATAWPHREPDRHWIAIDGDRIASSLAACATPVVREILAAHDRGLTTCGDVPILVASAPGGQDGPRLFVALALSTAHADTLAQVTGAEIALVTDAGSVVTSLRDLDDAPLPLVLDRRPPATGEASGERFGTATLQVPRYRGYLAATAPYAVGASSLEVFVYETRLATLDGRRSVRVLLTAPREVLDEGAIKVSIGTGLVAALIVAALLACGHVLVRGFSGNLARLTDAADRIGRGADGVRVGLVGGGVELGLLATTFDEMAENIARLRDEQVAAAERRAAESALALEELRSTHEALRVTQDRLVDASRMAGMAEVATNVLHNVGNVLNTVNVAADVARRRVRESKLPTLERVVALLPGDGEAAGTFLSTDPRGRQVPRLLQLVAEALRAEHDGVARELEILDRSVDHIKSVVRSQQEMATFRGGVDLVAPSEVLDAALALQGLADGGPTIEVVRDFELIEPLLLDRHRTLQVVLNLLANACQAIRARGGDDGCIVVRLARQGDDVRIEVSDDGIGIPPELRERIFEHGFTTRTDGHGFGLHSSANAAVEMGGSLAVHSNGLGTGATFVLRIPARRPAASQERGGEVSRSRRAGVSCAAA